MGDVNNYHRENQERISGGKLVEVVRFVEPNHQHREAGYDCEYHVDPS